MPAGTTGADAGGGAADDRRQGDRGGPRRRRQLRDLDWAPEVDTEVEPVAIDTADGLNVLRHSTAHVLAQAVQELFPEAKLGIGPPIENGFYYDFDVASRSSPEDLDSAREADAGDHQGRASGSRRRAFDSPTRRRRSWPTSRTSWS